MSHLEPATNTEKTAPAQPQLHMHQLASCQSC